MEVGSQSHAPSVLPPGKTTRYPLHRRLGGPQGRSGWVRKISLPLGFDPRTVQPVASRYYNWTIPTHPLTRRDKTIANTQTVWIFYLASDLKVIANKPLHIGRVIWYEDWPQTYLSTSFGVLSRGCILYKWRRSGILNLLPTNVIYNVYSINWFNRIHTYVVCSIAFTDNYNLLHVSALSAPSLGNADCAYIKRSSTQHMFSRSVSKDFENQNEQIYSVFTYKTAILYKIFAFKHLIPLREWIFFFFELGRTLLKWTNCAPKNYILLQFYIEILNTLLLNIIFQVIFSKAHAVRFIVMLCL